MGEGEWRIASRCHSPFATRYSLFGVMKRNNPFFAGLATTYSPMSYRQSTLGAKAFDGQVRDGIGSESPCKGHQAGEKRRTEDGGQTTERLSVLCSLSSE